MNSNDTVNNLLVSLFDEIIELEERVLIKGEFKDKIDIRFYNDRVDIFYNSHETNITYYIAKEKVNISYILTEFEIGTDGIIAIPRLQMIYDNVIEGIIKEAAITSLILLGGLSSEILK